LKEGRKEGRKEESHLELKSRGPHLAGGEKMTIKCPPVSLGHAQFPHQQSTTDFWLDFHGCNRLGELISDIKGRI